MGNRLSGHCHCGAIHVDIPADASGVIACHCQDCQKMHGNFNSFIAVSKHDVRMTGVEHLIWYQSSERSRRAFCRTCGSRILKELTAAGRWLISTGLIEEPTGKHIIKNLWEQSKPDW